MPSFSCKHILRDGTLNVGKNTVIFYGGSDATKSETIKIHLEDVAEINKVPDDGIYFITGDGTDYVFIKIEHIDVAFKAVEKARNLSLSTEFGQDENTSHTPRKHVRRGSDSNIVVSQNSIDLGIYADSDKLDELLESIADLTYSMKIQKSSDKLNEGKDEKKRQNDVTKSIKLLSFIGKKHADPQTGWNSLKKSKDKIVKEVALSNIKVKCTFESFFKNYWSGSAVLPISKYQESVILDQNINTSGWDEGVGGTLVRSIEYLHPNDAPMGPKFAGSIKEQVLEKFGTYGMVLSTTTTVKDVPMADCFVLLDKIFVEPISDGVLINAHIGIKFVKSTMWKRVIEKNAKKGITKWLNGYVDFLTKG